jgi:trans-aconitate methyltransferase
MKNHHEFDGKQYRKASTHQKEWGNRIISGLDLKGGESVLDLGCGDGVLTKQLSDLVPNGSVLGIDASEGMIREARKLEGGNLSFRLMDIRDIGFESEFDFIFSNATLHWIKDHRKLLSDCRRALRPNGIIRFSFAGDGNCMNFNAVVKEAMDLRRFKRFFGDFEWPWFMPAQEAYRSLVSSSGFAEFEVRTENADRYFESEDAMVRWIDQPSLVPFLSVLPGEERPAFRDRVVRGMIEAARREDGRCFETFRRIHVRAGK